MIIPMKVRKPVVSGSFYPSNRSELIRSIEWAFTHEFGPGRLPPAEEVEEVKAIVSPHAGYMYSGPVAAHGYFSVSNMDVELVIVTGPNHWGMGSMLSTYEGDAWETPLGLVEIDKKVAKGIARESGLVDFDELSHLREHSIEVQLPFLQYIYKQFKFVPICMGIQGRSTAEELGRAVAKVIKGKKVLLVASSDFTHYEPHEVAVRKDSELIKTIENLDVSRFYTVLERTGSSTCGYGAIAMAMIAAKELGASKGEVLKYATSGDITGDKGSVVGYASIRMV